MDAAKIRLSPDEAALVKNADWILLKNGIFQKATLLLSGLQQQQQAVVENAAPSLPAGFPASSPKISKGENYLGLPYLVSDYPRFFNKENVLAIRSFFWWGHFFSCTLHLAGSSKQLFAGKIMNSLAVLQEQDYAVCIHADPWQHHFEADNYRSLREVSLQELQELLAKNDFIKIARKISLDEWDNSETALLHIFRQYLQLLSA